MDEFDVERTLMDVTFGSLNPQETRVFESTTKNMTTNTVTAAGSQGFSMEITSIEVIPPQVPVGGSNPGAYEDLREIWLILDNKSVQHYVNLSGYGETLMTPPKSQIWGGRQFQVTFGMPFHKVVNSGATKNMPIMNTTFKYSNTLALAVHTVYGITGNWRIRIKGFKYTPAELSEYGKHWHNAVDVQDMRRIVTQKPALSFTFPLPGPISPDTWTSLPGGVLQGGTKINPYWRFAFNGQPTQPQSPFVFSNFNTLNGGTGNVEDPFQDLGLEFSSNLNAFILKGFGVRGVKAPPGTPPSSGTEFSYPSYPGTPGQNLARTGWWVNGDLVPEVNGGAGLFLTQNVDDLIFGALRPQIALDNLFYPIPKYGGSLLIYKDNAVPFIGANGSPIPAFSVMAAYNGTLVERG